MWSSVPHRRLAGAFSLSDLAPPQHPERGPLEVDALFRQLAPGAQMQAHWNLLRYTVPDARQVQQQFLCSKAKELQVINACVASSAAP